MASEVIKLNLIPSGEMPTFHCSQFDNGREILIDLFNGEDEYSLPVGYTAELHTRKMDNNIVTLATTSVSSNHLTFTSTEQLTACAGNNLSEVSIKDASDYVVGTLNFWLYVEKDPLQGGLTSTSAIHDLTDQIEEITTEIVGENYYNKSETDDLLDLKADKSTTYTKTEVNTLLNSKADASSVYTKSETNTLLSAKADVSDVYTKSQVETKLAAKANADDVYTKSETDTLLSAKADANGVYNKVEVDAMVDDLEDAIDLKADVATTYTKTEVDNALLLKANAADVYTKTEVDNIILDIMPVDTASGPIASFVTELDAPLVNVSCDVVATGGNGTPDNPNPIVGYSSANIVNTQNESIVDLFSIDSDFRGTVAFNQLVQNGKFNSTSGWSVANGTLSINSNIATITATANGNTALYRSDYAIPSNHVIVLTSKVKGISGKKFVISSVTNSQQFTATGDFQNIGYVEKATSYPTGYPRVVCKALETDDTFDVKYLNIFDLTQMFGSTIADYIYSLEQNNAGAGVAFFRSIYPEDYYAYDSGTTEIVGKETPEAVISFGQTVYGGQLIILPDRTYIHATRTGVDLGSLTWVKSTTDVSGVYRYVADLVGVKQFATLGTTAGNIPEPLVCENYPTIGGNDGYDRLYDKTISGSFWNGANKLQVCESTPYADGNAFKTAMSDVMLTYELATPFDIELTPVQIRALVGENNVYSDTNGNTTVKFKDSIQHYIDTHTGG